jgi:hypothetical protein
MRVTPRGSRLAGSLLVLAGIVSFSTLAGHGYVANGHTWATRSVPYLVNPANADLTEGEAEAAIRQGADTWGSQSQAGFAFAYAGRTTGTTLGYNGKNESFFRNTSNGSVIAETLWTYDGTGALVDADVVFYDGGWRFFTGTSGCSSGYYVEDIAAHEFGHALGLGHSSDAAATMYPTAATCTLQLRTLGADDIAGVEALYPPTVTQLPASPGNLTAAASATSPSSAVSLRWSDNSQNEDAFLVERTSGGTSYVQVARLGPNTTTFNDANLSPATAYTYRVRASNAAGFSGYTNAATATTASRPASAPGAPAPASPANGATGVSVDADLSWTCTGADQYDVYLGTTAPPPGYATGVGTSSLALPRLVAGTTYYWKVVARNSAGSTTGDVWQFTTKAARTKKR